MVVYNLSRLAEALENKDEEGDFAEFVKAAAAGTNTQQPHKTRFSFFCRALQSKPLCDPAPVSRTVCFLDDHAASAAAMNSRS
jgi:hypothetical protein